VSATETACRQVVKNIVNAEFAPEGFVVADDRLPRAAGQDGKTHVAASPEGPSEENARDVGMLKVTVLLQLYRGFDPTPNADYAVDPTIIEGYAGRLRSAFRNPTGANDDTLWYPRLTRIEFPPDPTGNSSRLEAYISGWAQNDAGVGA
jgi:hypothetical protein